MRLTLQSVIRRLLSAGVTLSVLSVSLFFLVRSIPGGPFDSDQMWPPEVQANILRHYGLDRPMSEQLRMWIQQLAAFDLGESFQFIGTPVSELIRDAFKISATLGGMAFLFAIVAGISIGLISGHPRCRAVGRIAGAIATLFLATPSYLLGALLVLLFALGLGWFPPALLESPSSYVLPVAALAARPWAMIFQMTRAGVSTGLQSDYVRTAIAKGLSPSQILWTHVLKNALLPVLSILGPIGAHLLTGSFVVELVFQLPGLGKYFVGAVLNRDYPLVQGLALTFGAVLLLMNVVFEALQSALDPRLEEGGSR